MQQEIVQDENLPGPLALSVDEQAESPQLSHYSCDGVRLPLEPPMPLDELARNVRTSVEFAIFRLECNGMEREAEFLYCSLCVIRGYMMRAEKEKKGDSNS